MTEPNEHAESPSKPVANYKQVMGQWYVDITVPDPFDETLPPALVSIPVPNEWWAKFLSKSVNTHDVQWWEDFNRNQLRN